MIIYKHELNNSYKIIDFRETKENFKPTEHLDEEVSNIQRISYEQYLKNKDKFNFPISIIKNEKGQEIVKWREMEGVILQNADKIDKEFNYRTECHVWSYKSAMKKLKECKEFWLNYNGNIMDAKIKIKNRRPSREDFY